MVPRLVSGRPSGVPGSRLVTTTAAAPRPTVLVEQAHSKPVRPVALHRGRQGARPLGAHSQGLCSCEMARLPRIRETEESGLLQKTGKDDPAQQGIRGVDMGGATPLLPNADDAEIGRIQVPPPAFTTTKGPLQRWTQPSSTDWGGEGWRSWPPGPGLPRQQRYEPGSR